MFTSKKSTKSVFNSTALNDNNYLFQLLSSLELDFLVSRFAWRLSAAESSASSGSFFIMQFCFNFDQTDNQKRVNFSHLFKVYKVHVFYRQSKMFAGFTLAQVVSTWSWIRAPVLKSLLTFWIVTIKSRRYVHLDHSTTRTTVTSSPLITWLSEMDNTSFLTLTQWTGRRPSRLISEARSCKTAKQLN